MKKNEIKNIIEEVFKKEKKNKFTFLTGAGISADSGIPTYRGTDGIWIKGTEHFRPEYFGTYGYFIEYPEVVWQYTLYRKGILEKAKPNKSHLILTDIENLIEDRFHLITQNVDNLHSKAGTKNIFEIHGNYREVKCSMNCDEILPIPKVLKSKGLTEDLSKEEIKSLKCKECGHWLRANILWFDENYDERTNKKDSALRVAKNTGILFIIGTSGATTLPLRIAQKVIEYGGYVIDINIEDSEFTKLLKGKKRSFSLRGKSSEILPEIYQCIKNCVEQRI